MGNVFRTASSTAKWLPFGDQNRCWMQVTKRHTFSGHRDCVYALAGGEASTFFSAGGDGLVVQWDLQEVGDGALVARVPKSVYALLHLDDTGLLVAGQNFSGLHLIDYRNKKEVASLQLTDAAIFDIQRYHDDLLVASGDGLLTVVNLKTWTVTHRQSWSTKSARCIAVNAAAGEAAIGYSDCSIRVVALDGYTLKQEIPAHQNSVFTVRYSPDGKLLLSGSRDARLKAWQVGAPYVAAADVAAHLFAINHLTYSPDGTYLATASMDKSIKVWRAADLQLLKVIDKGRHAGHGTSVNKLLWSPYQQQLLSASDDRSISAWDLLFL